MAWVVSRGFGMNITPSRTSRARLQTGRRLAHVVPIDLIERAVAQPLSVGRHIYRCPVGYVSHLQEMETIATTRPSTPRTTETTPS